MFTSVFSGACEDGLQSLPEGNLMEGYCSGFCRMVVASFSYFLASRPFLYEKMTSGYSIADTHVLSKFIEPSQGTTQSYLQPGNATCALLRHSIKVA